MATKKDVDSSKTALTENEIKNTMKKNNINAVILDLVEKFKPIEKIGFVYTGNEPNDINNNITHHWLLKINNFLFDSYGKQPDSYKMPEGMTLFKNHPNQYQEYAPASVCGEYCCVMLKLYHENKNDKDFELDQLSIFMADILELTNDKLKNDEIILDTYNKLKNGNYNITKASQEDEEN